MAPVLWFLIAVYYLSIKWITCRTGHKNTEDRIYIGGSSENIDDSLFLGSFVAVTSGHMSDDCLVHKGRIRPGWKE